jgi:hypothetical protein
MKDVPRVSRKILHDVDWKMQRTEKPGEEIRYDGLGTCVQKFGSHQEKAEAKHSN